MDGEAPTTGELLEAWREATRASERAEHLAKLASEAAVQADDNEAAVEEIAILAEKTAAAAERAAATARISAERAAEVATRSREHRLRDTDAAGTAVATESDARDRYREAERHDRERAD